MGLKVGSAQWSYSGFHCFRKRLAIQIDINLRAMEGFGGNTPWSAVNDPIVPLLDHSDCEGELNPEECHTVGPRLRELVAEWPEDDDDRLMALRLADDMADCAALDTPLEFH